MEAITREEQLLNSIATKEAINIDPITREEQYLAYIAGLTDKKPEKAITRKEMFYDAIAENGAGGGDGTAKPEQSKTVEIVENGDYKVTPDNGKVLSSVTAKVNVPDRYDEGFQDGQESVPNKPEQEKTVDITENGTTEVTPDEGKTLSKVTVNVDVVEGVKDIVFPNDITGLESYKPEVEGFPYTYIRVADFVPFDKYKDCQIFYRPEYDSEGGGQWETGGTENCIKFETDSYMDLWLAIWAVSEDNETFDLEGLRFVFPKSGMYIAFVPEYNATLVKEIKFPENIPGKPYIDTSKITDFSYFCKGSARIDSLDNLDTSNGTEFNNMFESCLSNTTSIPPLDTSNGVDFGYMFSKSERLQTVTSLNTSKGTNFAYMFQNCYSLVSIPPLDTSNGRYFRNMFYSCSNITSIPPLDTSNGVDFTSMFYDCSKVTTISITTAKSDFAVNSLQNCSALTNLTIGEGWAVNIYLTRSNAVSQESLHGMIENLADLTGQTTKTFQVGETNLAKIDEEHLAMLTAKNWSYS